MIIADLKQIAGRTYPARRRTQNLVGGASPIQATSFSMGHVTLEPDGGPSTSSSDGYDSSNAYADLRQVLDLYNATVIDGRFIDDFCWSVPNGPNMGQIHSRHLLEMMITR